MNRAIPKIALVLFSIAASVMVATRPGVAQDAGTQEPAEKPVEQVFKNIKVLNGMPQSQLYPTMRFMAASLGFQCGNCHVIKGFIDAAADDKPEKETARQMIEMVIELNKTKFQGSTTVSCYTCHRAVVHHRIFRFCLCRYLRLALVHPQICLEVARCLPPKMF